MRTVAEGLEWSYGWQPGAAQRLRCLVDFCCAAGLRAGEFVDASVGMILETAVDRSSPLDTPREC